ncbi:hypothetical protein NQZ68_016072 [Dissostichus eleginoides]|nr:hypothetical protein NQZ68_016072 [Dissostichus eleginoides]
MKRKNSGLARPRHRSEIRKLQQKALQQPKQKKSKSAEFLMERDESATLVGIENPAFDGGGSSELSIPPVWLGREIRGDRPDSTLAAHRKKTELQAPAKERGNKRAQNYFDPSSAEQTDPRHCGMAGVSTEDELELSMPFSVIIVLLGSLKRAILNADENRLYHRMAAMLDEDDTFINIPGTLLASRDEEVLEVKAGDPVLQLHGGGEASGSTPSQTQTIGKAQTGASAGPGGEAGLEAGRMVMGRESAVKMRPVEEQIPHYAQQLRERVRPDMITLGSLSLQQQAAQKGPLKRSEWANRKKELMDFFAGNVKVKTRLISRIIESPSLRALGEGQEEAMAKYGQMTELPESSSSASRPQWQVDQITSPQPVEVCVCCLRATRDKLPRGLYTVSVALHSRLGGPALTWRSKKEQHERALSTEPIEHRGRYCDTDLNINQSLFMICPAACEVVPSMVLVFQLIALPGDGSHISSVLAWGAFPVCGSSLGLVQGRFKTPLLRGEPNTRLDQFKKIEAVISSDLDHWLCNLYFQVKRLPSGTSGVPERCITLSIPPPNPSLMPHPEVHLDQPPGQLPIQSQAQLRPQPQLYPQQAGPSSRAGEPSVVLSHRGSPLYLSADSACSSSSLPDSIPLSAVGDFEDSSSNVFFGALPCTFRMCFPPGRSQAQGDNKEFVVGLECPERLELWQLQRSEFTDVALSCRSCRSCRCCLRAHHGKNSSSGAISGNTGEKSDPSREKAEGGIHYKKKPIKKTNSCGPSMSSAPPRQADKQKMQPSVENLSTEEMEEYTFSLQRDSLRGKRDRSAETDREKNTWNNSESQAVNPRHTAAPNHNSVQGSINSDVTLVGEVGGDGSAVHPWVWNVSA